MILVEAQGEVEQAQQHDQTRQNRRVNEEPVEAPTEGPRARSHGDGTSAPAGAREGIRDAAFRPLRTRSRSMPLYALRSRHLAYARITDQRTIVRGRRTQSHRLPHRSRRAASSTSRFSRASPPPHA